MKKSIFCLLSAMFLIGSCTQPVVEMFGSISGYVMDDDSGSAISGARVALTPTGSSQVTSADGEFLFDNLDAQEYTISIKKDGYEDMSQKVSVKAGVTSSVQVSLSPIQPVLKVEPEILDFGGETTSLALDITNIGKGTLEWTIDEDIEWITCSAASGETTDKIASVVVKASRDGMEKGSYTETIVISSNGGSAIVKVKMSVGSSIKLSVNPEELDFGFAESQIQMTVTNSGQKTVKYNISSANDWLRLDKTSSSVQTTDYINAVVSRAGLDAGQYTSSITLSSDGGEIIIPVKMKVLQKSAPTVTIESVEDIAYNSASVNGTVVSIGSSKITRHGFCYSTSNKQPSVDDEVANLGDCSTPKAFKSTITNLKSTTTYYVRAFAENQEGMSYSDAISFTTSDLPKLAEVKTGEATEIAAKTAIVSGVIKHLGNVNTLQAHGHVWNTTGNPSLTKGDYTDLGECSETATFKSSLKGLEACTTYYVRAYATNEKGTAYGEEITFTTKKQPVSLSDATISEVTHNSALAKAEIISTAGHTIVEKGFCYYLAETDDYMFVEADKNFTAKLTGLESESKYWIGAYVVNSDGDFYWSQYDIAFTTKEAPKNPTNGLYAYYTFENNTTNTVSGAPNGSGINTSYVDGIQGSKALKFSSSSSKLNIPEAIIDNGTFSISFWIKDFNDGHIFDVVTSLSYGSAFVMAVRNGLFTYVQEGYYFWYMFDEPDKTPSFAHSTLNASEWHLITMTSKHANYDTELRFYIDGEYLDKIVLDFHYDSIKNGTKLVFGGPLTNSKYSTNNLNWTSMSIDNLRIYNTRVLTAEEVKQIYDYEK